jgi:hypothetical protein
VPASAVACTDCFVCVQVEQKRRAVAEAEAAKLSFTPQLATARRSPSPSGHSVDSDSDPFGYARASEGGRRKSLAQRTAEHVAKQQEKLFYGAVSVTQANTREELIVCVFLFAVLEVVCGEYDIHTRVLVRTSVVPSNHRLISPAPPIQRQTSTGRARRGSVRAAALCAVAGVPRHRARP